MPFSLGSTHDFISVLDHVFGSLGLSVGLLNLFVLLLLKLDLAQEWVECAADEVVGDFDKLLRDGVGQQLLAELADQLFDLFTLLIIAKRHSLSVGASSCRSTDSVQVPLGLRRETKVENGLHRGYVYAPCNQISG